MFTATARHIALMLQQEGYEIVPIKDIRKIEDYCDPHSPQVFVIDDVELEEMNKQNKIQYASLVLCMMNENKISENILDETNKEKVAKSFQEMRKRVLWKCKVSSETNNYKFVDALSAMEGTYTKMYGTEYSFVHDSMFEILAYHFGRQFPELILQYMSSSYIANNVKLQKRHEQSKQNLESEHKQESENIEVSVECKEEEGNIAFNGKSRENMESFDLYIRLREDQYSMLTERLYKDVENMELYDVFMNDILKEPKVCKSFIEVLKTKSYTVLKSLFLSVQKNVSKVVSKRDRLDKESEGRIGKMKWPRQRFVTYRVMRGQEVLVNERKKEYSVRVISWVIYYKHNQILQFILEQTDLNKETQSELFTNSLNPDLSLITEEGENNKNTEQYRLLVLSCYSGDLEIVRRILKYFNRSINSRALTNINYEHFIYDTPLTIACMEGHINVVKELIEEGADINHQGEYNTPLTAACEGGHISVVKELIQAGADINLRGEFNTPLVTACECGHKSIVTELIEMGADVNPQTQLDSPLTTACVGGEMSLIKELIQAGADVNPQGKYNTPLKKACLGGDLSLVKMLIEAGADDNTDGRADVNLQGEDDTPLINACEEGHLNVVKELIEAGADVNLQGKYSTPLVAACANGHSNVIKELIEAGTNVNLHTSKSTPLLAACRNRHFSLVKQLIEAGADVNLQSKYDAPLGAACENWHLGGIRITIEEDSEINMRYLHDSPQEVWQSEHLNAVKELLEAGAYIRHSDVGTDFKDDVVVTQRRVWCMQELGNYRDSVFDDLIDDDDDEGEGERLVFDSENVYDIYPTDDEGEDSVLDNEIASDNHSTDEEGEGSGLDSEIASDNHSTDEEGEGSGLDSENASDNHSTDEFNDQEKKEVISMLDREGVSVLGGHDV
ncbi:uncharacterized protein LOC134230535 [Saccostrea cucullata]|uniref:uncharacterized protein LOC134230535 n=1 Tax=Saccostrea cuccullata TaxID=36930 RepID=UPI002ED2568C